MNNATTEKIKKLLALSQSSNENEALSALTKAHQLMNELGISEDDLPSDKQTWSVEIITRVMDVRRVDYLSLNAFTTLLIYPVHALRRGGKIHFFGQQEFLDSAMHTFQYLNDLVELEYKHHLPRGLSKSDRAQFRKNFKNSMASGIQRRMREITNRSTGLVTQALRQGLAEKFNIHIKDSKKVVVNRGFGSAEGFSAGQRAVIQPAVHSSQRLLK